MTFCISDLHLTKIKSSSYFFISLTSSSVCSANKLMQILPYMSTAYPQFLQSIKWYLDERNRVHCFDWHCSYSQWKQVKKTKIKQTNDSHFSFSISLNLIVNTLQYQVHYTLYLQYVKRTCFSNCTSQFALANFAKVVFFLFN